MRLHPLFVAGVLGFIAAAGACRAGDAEDRPAPPPSPLRLVPAEADLVLQVRDPARVAALARKLDVLPRLLEFPLLKEQLDGTTARRLRQLLAYGEKTLGAKWPELLDRLAGGGVALAAKFGANPVPFLLVVQGKDAKLMEHFVKLAGDLIEAELARQESKDKLEKGDYHGIPGFQVGKDLWVARAGAALVVSNRKDALARALDLHLGKRKNSLATHPPLVEARKLLPPSGLAEAWVNLKPLQQSEAARAFFKTPRDNPALTVLFGGYLDVLGRSPYLCAALTHDRDGYRLSVCAPRGRDGMGAERELHLPPKGQPGGRPLLEPPGVLYSASFYLDPGRIWKDRDRLFPPPIAAGLSTLDTTGRQAILGTRISKLLESVGAHHRLVVVNQARPGYRKRAAATIPAFAFIVELRKPDRFALAVDAGLRAAALAVTNNVVKMKLVEEKHRGVEIAAYRFDETEEVKQDSSDVRFAFSPCWARVGNQFVFCSTVELCRDLVDLLQAEQKTPGQRLKYRAHDRYYAAGFADLLAGIEDQLITQAVLDHGVEPDQAKKQVKQLVDLVRGLGHVSSHVHVDEKVSRYEFRFGGR
jgi:hypothetical protein